MPRRSVLTEAQHVELFALPESEPDLVRYWTLSSADLRVITSRRRPHTIPMAAAFPTMFSRSAICWGSSSHREFPISPPGASTCSAMRGQGRP